MYALLCCAAQAKSLLKQVEDVSAKLAGAARDHADKSKLLLQRATKLVRARAWHWLLGLFAMHAIYVPMSQSSVWVGHTCQRACQQACMMHDGVEVF